MGRRRCLSQMPVMSRGIQKVSMKHGSAIATVETFAGVLKAVLARILDMERRTCSQTGAYDERNEEGKEGYIDKNVKGINAPSACTNRSPTLVSVTEQQII
jgi:hypothetical protein